MGRGDTIDEILKWPWKRFEGMYAAMVKREAVKAIEVQKHQMIASLYGNSAFDESEKGIEAREKRIKGIEEHFTKAIEMVYHPELHEAPELDWNNPFWAAAKRAKEQRLARARGEDPDAPVEQHVAALEGSQPDQFDPDRKRSYDQL